MTKLAASDRLTNGERTRAHILDTALELFAEHGYTDTTMRDSAAAIRTLMLAVFRQVVGQATDAPRPQQVQDLALILDVLHLALIVVWLHDRSPEQHATMQLLELSHDTLRRLRWFLRLPPVARLLARLAQALQPLIISLDRPTVESSRP